MNEESDAMKLGAIARGLLLLTQNERIKWDKDPLSDDSYSYSTTDSSVIIRSRDADSRFPYILSVRDQDGDTVATLTVADDSRDVDQRRTISELYNSARRSALKVDVVLDNLVNKFTAESGGNTN